MKTDKLVELFREEVEKLEKEAYERGKRDAFEKSKEFYDALESVANIEQPVQPLSANQQRKGLIEQAREFIKKRKDEKGLVSRRLGYRATNGILIVKVAIWRTYNFERHCKMSPRRSI